MVILNVEDKTLLLDNKVYDKETCWDYPPEEIELLQEDEVYQDIVFIKYQDRIYETKIPEIFENIIFLINNRNCDLIYFKKKFV